MRSIPDSIRVLLQHGKPWLLLAVALSFSACAHQTVRRTSRSFSTVIIDAGHGGKDRGTQSSRLIAEKDAALDIALKVNARLQSAGVQTKLIRSGDYFVELDERVNMSNAVSNAIFVSVHLNECRPRRDMHGVETYYFSAESQELAQRILRKVGALPGESPHFMKTARFRVLRNNRNPAVLVECGYLSNRAEAERFASASYRSTVANAIAEAILEQRGG
ncbi:MAG TPA: N-acetylmuramoyl-L-alanine amidase [Chthoniobacteraceae bacterium]|jgi:N-acetylmuramoyl-L-alanine amidase|nr:N-acetylmuramoyl-L-alanine amidase [Chthoniobacteraceae bacterium]